MHELSITKELIRIALDECKGEAKYINVKLGKLTSFCKDPILFYFDQLKTEYPKLKDSALLVEEIDGEIECKTCKTISTIEDPTMIFCPACESSDINYIKGRDIVIESIENVR